MKGGDGYNNFNDPGYNNNGYQQSEGLSGGMGGPASEDNFLRKQYSYNAHGGMGAGEENRLNTISHDLPRNRVNHTPGVNAAMRDMLGGPSSNDMTPTHGGANS